MKIAFRDFYYATTTQGGLFKSAAYETSSQLMSRVNRWVESEGINIINIETVIVPRNVGIESTDAFCVHLSGDESAYWYQFFRIWYQAA